MSRNNESANAGTTKLLPFLKNERTNYAPLAKVAHDFLVDCQMVALIVWWTLVVDPKTQNTAPHTDQTKSGHVSTAQGAQYALQHLRDLHGKLIIINRIVWHGTSEQRHSLAYTCANP